MKPLTFFLMLLLLSFFSAYSQLHIPKGSTQQKVLQLERDVVKAILAGDTMKLNKYYANDYKGYYDPYFENKEMLLKNNVTPWEGLTIQNMEMDARVYGTAAVVNGIWEIKWANQKPGYRRFTDMLIKGTEGWKIVASHQNNISAWRVRSLSDSEFVAVTAQNCGTESTLKSLNSDVPTLLRIKNNTAGEITMYWINYSGQRDTSADQIHPIAAGKIFDQQTFVTHPFVLIGSNGKCYGIYMADSNPSMVIVKE